MQNGWRDRLSCETLTTSGSARNDAADAQIMQVQIFAEICCHRVEIRRRPAVLFGLTIRIGKNQIFRDLAQRMIAGKGRDAFLLRGSGNCKVGSEEQRPRHKGRDVFDETRVLRSGNQPLAHDDVRLKQLHHR